MKCNSTKCKVMLLMAEIRLFCYKLTAGACFLEVIVEKDVDVLLVPVLGHSLSASSVALWVEKRWGSPVVLQTLEAMLVAVSSSH